MIAGFDTRRQAEIKSMAKRKSQSKQQPPQMRGCPQGTIIEAEEIVAKKPARALVRDYRAVAAVLS